MEKAKFFCGIIINPTIEMDVLTEELSLLYGEVDYIGGPLDFNYTSYYEEEFGQNLRRYFISFENLIHPGKLAEIKRETISLEKKFSQKGKRQVNIDPGYMEPSKLVLASTKNFSHRIYIGQGIYAEITLLWRKGKFRDLEWTFPDYRSIEYKLILDKIRELYMNSRR